MRDQDPALTRIERYLSGHLKPEETKAFEAECEADPALRVLLESQLQIKGALWKKGHEREKAALIELDEKLESERKAHKTRLALIAAATLAVIFLGVTYLFSLSGASSEELFLTYYQRPQAQESLKLGTDSLMLQPNAAFNLGKIEEASAAYQEFLDAKTSDTELRSQSAFFLGICRLEQGRPEEALAAFDQTHSFPEQAEWYRMLALLRKGDAREARFLAEKIAGTQGHFFQKNARALLQSM